MHRRGLRARSSAHATNQHSGHCFLSLAPLPPPRQYHANPDPHVSLLCNPTMHPLLYAFQVESAAWNDKSDVLTAIADGRLITWYYADAVSMDRDLLSLASTSRDAAEFGKVSLAMNRGTQRRRDHNKGMEANEKRKTVKTIQPL